MDSDCRHPYPSAICRSLLNLAKLGHLWSGTGLKPGSAKLVGKLRQTNARDALILQVVLAILDHGEGPVLKDILALSPMERAILLTAPLAAQDAKYCQVWMIFFGAYFGLNGSGVD